MSMIDFVKNEIKWLEENGFIELGPAEYENRMYKDAGIVYRVLKSPESYLLLTECEEYSSDDFETFEEFTDYFSNVGLRIDEYGSVDDF